jgi:ABC-2 type transport system permease protein
MALPLVLFPGWLGTLAQALPWSALVQVPNDIWLGRHDGTDLWGALAFQAGWGVVLLLASQGVLRLATRKVVVQGG